MVHFAGRYEDIYEYAFGSEQTESPPAKRGKKMIVSCGRAFPECGENVCRCRFDPRLRKISVDCNKDLVSPACEPINLKKEMKGLLANLRRGEPRGSSDTSRFLAAGACRSLWVRIEEDHSDAAQQLLPILQSCPFVMIESNRILSVMRPDLYLMVLRYDTGDFKDSARLSPAGGCGCCGKS